MYRSALLALVVVFSLTACRSDRADQDYAERMAVEHSGETPVATAGTAGADTLDVDVMDVVYATVEGQEISGYLAKPREAEGPVPGVIVIHEWWGLNDNIRAMTRKLAAEGYAALAVDLYRGRVAENPSDARTYMGEAMENAEASRENLRQAHNFLSDEYGAPRVGSIGWCFGGGWSLQSALAMPDELDVTVIYYGRLVTDSEALASIEAPIIGFFGAEDDGIPVEQVRTFERALNDLGKDVEVHVYGGADHAFANPSGERYNEEAAADSWQRTVAFLAEHLK
ncbi:MAG: dienelactone hydrolase family protein [Rubricoccaceae bacterium]|nr:dienelactone hydrolase family protein [Rubricoccaceae bacterium]